MASWRTRAQSVATSAGPRPPGVPPAAHPDGPGGVRRADSGEPPPIKGASQRDWRHRTERRVLAHDELRALADATRERYRAAVVVSFLSDLRAGELFALQRKHVDLAAGTIRVEQSRRRSAISDAGRFSATKSRAGLRTVVLPAVATETLTEHMARFTPTRRDVLVFGTASGRPLTSGSRSTMFARARRAIGRDDLRWHDLRHSARTLVARTSATLPELMQRAGHSTPRGPPLPARRRRRPAPHRRAPQCRPRIGSTAVDSRNAAHCR